MSVIIRTLHQFLPITFMWNYLFINMLEIFCKLWHVTLQYSFFKWQYQRHDIIGKREYWALHLCVCVCGMTLHHPFTFYSPFWPVLFLLVDSIVWADSKHTVQYITYTDTHSPTDGCRAAQGCVCVRVCVEEGWGEGYVVPRISITGSRAGDSPHTKDAGTLEALGPNRGRDGRGKGKSASACLTNSILTHIELYQVHPTDYKTTRRQWHWSKLT